MAGQGQINMTPYCGFAGYKCETDSIKNDNLTGSAESEKKLLHSCEHKQKKSEISSSQQTTITPRNPPKLHTKMNNNNIKNTSVVLSVYIKNKHIYRNMCILSKKKYCSFYFKEMMSQH